MSMRLFSLSVAVLAIAGCASSKSGDVYTREQARTAHEVQVGTVIDLRAVRIEGTQTGVGATAGGAIGGVSASGEGRSGRVGGVVGAVAGGIAGAAVEEVVTRKNGVEISVRLDNGRTVAVVQEADETFTIGERVRVLLGGRGSTRVTKHGP